MEERQEEEDERERNPQHNGSARAKNNADDPLTCGQRATSECNDNGVVAGEDDISR